jgi:hypothetical protein
VTLDPSKRFLTIVLALGTLVLLAAVAIGQSMGDRVIGQVTEHRLNSLSTIDVTPPPLAATGPYGPNWQRTQALASAPDPGFPDPRVPPQALPTPVASTPAPRILKAAATPTPNPNLPVWRQKPLPVKAPVRTPAAATPAPTQQPSPQQR